MSCWWRASCSQRTEWPWQRGRPSCCPSGCPELRPRLAAGRGSGVAEGTERTGRRESGTGVQGSAGMTAACSQGIWRGEKPGTGRQPPAGEAQPGLSSCCGLRAAGSPPRRDAPLSAFLSEPRLSSSCPSPATLPGSPTFSQGTTWSSHLTQSHGPPPSSLRWCAPGAPTTGLSSNMTPTGPTASASTATLSSLATCSLRTRRTRGGASWR